MTGSLIPTIVIFNLFVLVGVTVFLGTWQRRGKLTENTCALVLAGYFSFSFVTPLLPALISYPGTIGLVDVVALSIIWGLGYPWIRWLYRQFNSSRRK